MINQVHSQMDDFTENEKKKITTDLSPNQVCRNPPFGWEKVFKDTKREVQHSVDKVKKYKTCTPPLENVFGMYQYMEPKNIRVAIFTDEPENKTEKAFQQMHGFGISGSGKIGEINPIMEKVHERLFSTVANYRLPNHNSLEKWFEQGVFVSSIYLTTGMCGESHKPLWNGFTLHAIQHMSRVNPNIIFLFWGEEASDYVKYVRSHPHFYTKNIFSFQKNDENAFATMNHFNTVNKILEARQEPLIDWQL